jgi:hypothetical protein
MLEFTICTTGRILITIILKLQMAIAICTSIPYSQ